MSKIRVLTVFGTRPEGIKMAPIIKEMEKREEIESITCITAQHREMLDQVLDLFEIEPDFDLNIFSKGQTLTGITVKALEGLEKIIREVEPDLLLVQGDTTTVFSGALAAFYQQVKIGHVEAGLRSHNIYSPYPEEVNRRLTGIMTNFHFAPTENNRANLLREDYRDEDIYITGNTVIDALHYVIKDNYVFEDELLNSLDFDKKRIVLLTSHRRENLGEPMENIFRAVKDVVDKYDDVEVVFPIHLNPKVREIAKNVFKEDEKIHLVEPLDYEPFANLIAKSHLVVTDSGGLQEEAPSLGKPVLVVRKETERPEGVEAGTCKLLGVGYKDIYRELDLLLKDKNEYNNMAMAVNPYGEGDAAKQIVDIIVDHYK